MLEISLCTQGLQKYLAYKPGASAYTAADLDIDSDSEDSHSGKKRAAHKDAEEV